MSEQIALARVGCYLAHRSIGPALVEQVFDQMIGARRNWPMPLSLSLQASMTSKKSASRKT
jgi:hypothetical protein